MKLVAISLTLALLVGLLVAWNSVKEEVAPPLVVELSREYSPVMTAEEQAGLTPDEVLRSLKEGNRRFRSDEMIDRDLRNQVAASATGQFPKAVILSCVDSRVPVEMIFDKGVGDLFVGRVAGNFVNQDLLGSMEFGCRMAGSKLIVVMGHERCTAIQAAIDDVQLGHLTPMLEKINPALERSRGFYGDQTSANGEFVTHVSRENILHTINTIREESSILHDMEASGQIRIVGALYDMDTGEVRFLDDRTNS